MIALELYQDISQRIRKSSVVDLSDIAITCNVDHNTVLSIYSQYQQTVAKKASVVLKVHALSITKKWFDGATASNLAAEYSVPLSLLVRTIVSTLSSNYLSLQQNLSHASNRDGDSGRTVTLKPSIPHLPIHVSSKTLTQLLAYPAALYKVHRRLCADAFAALLSGDFAAPGIARIRHHSGEDYEYVMLPHERPETDSCLSLTCQSLF